MTTPSAGSRSPDPLPRLTAAKGNSTCAVRRRPLGHASMTSVLQIRVTPDVMSAVKTLGGSTWARETLLKALRRAVRDGIVRLPPDVLKSFKIVA